jgi:hypothetical protein
LVAKVLDGPGEWKQDMVGFFFTDETDFFTEIVIFFFGIGFLILFRDGQFLFNHRRLIGTYLLDGNTQRHGGVLFLSFVCLSI